MISYVLIGLGVYLGMSSTRLHTFKKVNILGFLRGLIFVVFAWPIAILCMMEIVKRETSK